MEEIMELIMDIKAILNRPTTKENIIENRSGYTTVLDDDPFRRSSNEVFIDQKPFNPPQFQVPWEETNKTLENFCKPHVAAKTKNKNNQEIQEEDCRAGERNESKFSNVVLDGETLLDSALPGEKDIDIISKHSDNISQQQHRYDQEGNNDRVLKRKKTKTEVEEYMDVIFQEIAYDPIRLPHSEDPSQMLYNRRTLERIWVTKHEVLNPYTRHPFQIQSVIPQTELREEMCQYIAKTRNPGLQIILDYTKRLTASGMICLLKDLVYHYRYLSQKKEQREEVHWRVLWQKINLIRLCCQYRPENRETFLSIKGYHYLLMLVDEQLRCYYSISDEAREVSREVARIANVVGLRESDLLAIPDKSVQAFVHILSDLGKSTYLKIQSMVLHIYCRMFYYDIDYPILNNDHFCHCVIEIAFKLLSRRNSRDEIIDEDLHNGTKILKAAWKWKRTVLLDFDSYVDVLVKVVILCISRYREHVGTFCIGKALSRALELIEFLLTVEDSEVYQYGYQKLLGFLKIINLVEYCKDVVVIRGVKRGCHLAFPVKPNERANRMPLPGGQNSYPNKNCQSKDKTRSESKPKPKRKAPAEDFRKCIYHMWQAGKFSQGFLMARLPQRFEQRTRKSFDVEHLGYKRMSELVASCSDPVTMKWDIFKISALVRLGTVILVAMERMTSGRYSVVEKLGSGSFGEVYKGIDVDTEENAAIKMERKDAKHPQLFHDSKIYEHISDGIGIPNIRWRGTKIDHSILVLDLLGPSLGNIFGYRQYKFNLKMVSMLTDQLIERIEYIYRRSVLHRDLKLDDLLMGISLTSKLVHLNDFRLSKLFQNSNSMRHSPLTTHKGLTRTVHYASINNHRGIEQSRRDDIESIGYALLYFLRGNLPWQDVMDSNKKRKFEFHGHCHL